MLMIKELMADLDERVLSDVVQDRSTIANTVAIKTLMMVKKALDTYGILEFDRSAKLNGFCFGSCGNYNF